MRWQTPPKGTLNGRKYPFHLQRRSARFSLCRTFGIGILVARVLDIGGRR